MSTATQQAPNAEVASGVRDYLVKCLEDEFKTTTRVLENVKPGEWRPDPKARTAAEIAWHIVHSDVWFLESVVAGEFNPATAAEGAAPGGMPEIIRYYEQHFTKGIAEVKKISGADIAKIVDFFGMKQPMFEALGFALVHGVHHRAQLSTYLRPSGGKVPSIYGGSADEPWQG
jgi:uncharacterized damage-inducible protein DinB